MFQGHSPDIVEFVVDQRVKTAIWLLKVLMFKQLAQTGICKYQFSCLLCIILKLPGNDTGEAITGDVTSVHFVIIVAYTICISFSS